MSQHNEIMNLPTKHDHRNDAIAYKEGHRDARHAAAELSLKYEGYIELLESELRIATDYAGFVVDIEEIK